MKELGGEEPSRTPLASAGLPGERAAVGPTTQPSASLLAKVLAVVGASWLILIGGVLALAAVLALIFHKKDQKN